MDVILGATGRVGSMLVEALRAAGRDVRAVVRNAAKAERLRRMGAAVAVADFANAAAVRAAFDGGNTVFIVTAEDPASRDGVAEAGEFLAVCRDAVTAAGVRRIIGLSSDGAQHASGTGFLMVSHRLEHAFDGLDVEQAFIRPSYYYSNWMMSLPLARDQGILPTFFPEDTAIPMIAPDDVARYAATVFTGEAPPRRIHEITGPSCYTPADIARMLSELLGREVRSQQIPREAWLESLTNVGFTPANARHMAAMTAAVLSGLTATESEPAVQPTSFPEYANAYLHSLNTGR